MQRVPNESPEKRFCVVSFPDEEESLYVVSSLWLKKGKSDDQHVCQWPPYKGDARVKRAVLEDERPASNWQTCTAKLIKKCKSYKGAESFLNAVLLVSSERSRLLYASGYSPCEGPAKKIKLERNDNYQSSSYISESSSESTSSVLPQAVCEVQEMAVENGELPAIVSSVTCHKSQASSSTYQFLLEATSVLDSTLEMTSNAEEESYSNCFSLEDKIDHIAKSLESVKRKVSTIQFTLEQEANSCNPQELQHLPLNSFEDLKNMNDKLADDKEFAIMARQLGLLGGKDEGEAIRRVLVRLISNELALRLNWIGGDRKKSIQEYKRVLQLAIVAVRHNKEFADISQSVIEDNIKRWLRYAGDRNGGRTKRRVFNVV